MTEREYEIPWERLREAQREDELRREKDVQLSLLTGEEIVATLPERLSLDSGFISAKSFQLRGGVGG